MKRMPELLLSAEQSVSGVSFFKIREQQAAILISAGTANDFIYMYKELSPTNATAYVKMSMDHQSLGDQMDVVQNFAKRQGLKIVKVYSDGANQAEHSKPAKAQK